MFAESKTYGQRGDYRHRDEYVPASEVFGYAISTLAVLAIIFVLIGGIFVDNTGRDGNEHIGPIPADVIEISRDSFLMPDRIKPETICDAEADPVQVETVANIRQLKDTVYVECLIDQEWNRSGPISPNLGNGIVRFASTGWVWTTLLAGFAIVMLLTITQYIARARQQRSFRHQTKMGLEQSRRELVKAWSTNEIDDLAFHTKMDDLYAKGLPPAAD